MGCLHDLFWTNSVLSPGKSQGRGSLVGCSPWGRQESDTTERLPFHFSLSCIGEGNGNPLQCSCLENPRDGGAWWAAVYGVAQSRTRLERLSSSSSSSKPAAARCPSCVSGSQWCPIKSFPSCVLPLFYNSDSPSTYSTVFGTDYPHGKYSQY